MTVTVRRNDELSRFEILVDGEVSGFSEFVMRDNAIVFTHTEVQRNEQERGLGGRLVQAALDQVGTETTDRVVALCPFVRKWMSEHPEYADLTSR